MQLVDLADEFRLTTSDALDLCIAAGIDADGSTAELTDAEVARWRSLAHQQQEWRARAAAEQAREQRERELARASARSSFGPIPPAPWEQTQVEAGAPAISSAPPSHDPDAPDLSAGWGVSAPTPYRKPQVSVYAAGALALAIISLIFPFATAVMAVPMALYAKHQIAKSRGALTGERLATAAIVVSAIGFALWAGLVVVSFVQDYRAHEALTTVPDIQVDTHQIQWDEIKPGDCVRIPHADLAMSSWQGVECSGPHEGEVYASTTLSDGPAEPYPGQAPFNAEAGNFCRNAFEAYVGLPPAQSELQISTYYPTRGNWVDEKDRTIGCIIYQSDYDLINGTLKNARR
jgi:hypothetical protein